MNKTLYSVLLFVFSSIILGSCSKDSNGPTTKTYPITFSIGNEEFQWRKDSIVAYIHENKLNVIIEGEKHKSFIPVYEQKFQLRFGSKIFEEKWLSKTVGREFIMEYDKLPNYFYIILEKGLDHLDKGTYSSDTGSKIHVTSLENNKISFTFSGMLKKTGSGELFPFSGQVEHIPLIQKEKK